MNKIKVYEYLDDKLNAYRNSELKKFLTNNKNIDFKFFDLQMYNNQKDKKELALDILNSSMLDSNIKLTSQQIEILSILKKNNIFISAPTSFGKTFIVLEYIKRNIEELNNIVIIVPTIALMNELLKKIYYYFSDFYNICINSFEVIEERNIFIFVPERSDSGFLDKVEVKKENFIRTIYQTNQF